MRDILASINYSSYCKRSSSFSSIHNSPKKSWLDLPVESDLTLETRALIFFLRWQRSSATKRTNPTEFRSVLSMGLSFHKCPPRIPLDLPAYPGGEERRTRSWEERILCYADQREKGTYFLRGGAGEEKKDIRCNCKRSCNSVFSTTQQGLKGNKFPQNTLGQMSETQQLNVT